MLTVEAVTNMFRKYEDPGGTLSVTFMRKQFKFEEALADERPNLIAMINELPIEFLKNGGGGWSFLNVCVKRDGEQWTGLHMVMTQFVAMSAALGMAKELGTPDLWQLMPGAVPYVVFDPEAGEVT